MKYLISESQLNTVLNEAKIQPKDLCNSFGENSSFCRRVEEILKDGRTGGKTGNISSLSAKFFKKVVTNTNHFRIVTLEPGVPEYEERVSQLTNFKEILENYDVCPEIIYEVEKDLENLPIKRLKMAVDDDNHYSLLNRLDTHYTAKAYLLSYLMLNAEDKETLKKEDDNKIRESLKIFLSDDLNIELVAGYLSQLLKDNDDFRKYFLSSLEYSREQGNKVESEVFNVLRKKYGEDNVFEFSGDFGFVDHFGVDGIVVINEFAHPVQISSVQKSPKIFKYSSEYCKPLGFYKNGSKVHKYEPLD